jgi:hypothetical protein
MVLFFDYKHSIYDALIFMAKCFYGGTFLCVTNLEKFENSGSEE